MTGSSARLVAVVVTYNRLDKLKASLGALLAHPPDVLQKVIVVDNASTDGTQVWLASRADDRLHVCRLPENRGGAGGFAAGFERARDAFDPDWLLVMDDDASPAPGTLERFLAKDRRAADGWAAAVYTPGGEISDMNRPVRNPFSSLSLFLKTLVRGREAFHLGPASYAESQSCAIDVASFVGLFLSRKALRLGGLPDAGLFLYADDSLYTLRLSGAGGVLRFDPTLVFSHDCESMSGGDGVIRPFWRAYFYHRNLLILYREAAGPMLFPFVRWIKMHSWRRRALTYGAERETFLRLLASACADAAADRKGITRDDIAARFPGGHGRNDGLDA